MVIVDPVPRFVAPETESTPALNVIPPFSPVLFPANVNVPDPLLLMPEFVELEFVRFPKREKFPLPANVVLLMLVFDISIFPSMVTLTLDAVSVLPDPPKELPPAVLVNSMLVKPKPLVEEKLRLTFPPEPNVFI